MIRKLASWVGVLLVALVALVVAVAGIVSITLRLPATREWVRAELEQQLSAALEERVAIEEVASLGVAGASVRGISIGEDPAALRVATIAVDVSFPDLTPPRVALSVSVEAPDLRLVRESDGSWNVERWGASDDDEDPAEIPRWLGRVAVEIDGGTVRVEGVSTAALVLSSLAARGQLWVGLFRDSMVELESLEATLGASSALDLHGTYELEGRQRLHAVLHASPLEVRDLEGLVPELREDAVVTGRAEIEGTIAEPRIELRAALGDGTLRATASLETDGTEDVVTGAFEATALDLTELLLDVSAQRLHGKGQIEARLDADDALRGLDGEVEISESRLFDIEVRRLAVEMETRDAEVAVRVSGATENDGARADLHGAVGLAAPHAATIAGDLALHDPAALSEELRGYLAGSDLTAEVRAAVPDPLAETPSANLELKVNPGRLRGLPVDGGELAVRLTPDLVSVDRLWLGADRTNLAGHAWAQLGGDASSRSVGGELRGGLSLGLLTDAHGVVEIDARFWGFETDLGFSALVDSSGPVELPGFEGTFSSRVEAEHLGPRSGAATVALTGAFGAEGGLSRFLGRAERSTTLDLSWERRAAESDAGPPLDRIEIDAGLGASESTGASLRAVVEQRGDSTRVDVAGLELRPVVGPAWTLVPPANVEMDAGEVRVDGVRIELGSAVLEASGRVAGDAGRDNDLSVRVRDLALADLCELFVVGDECAGDLRAGLRITGPASRPEVGFDLTVDGLSASEQRYGTLQATATTSRGVLALEATIEGGDAGSLELEGRLPLEAGVRAPVVAMSAPTRIDLRTTDFQIDVLRALVGRSIRELDGRATVRAELRGSLEQPRLDGSLVVDGLVVAATAAGATHRDGRLRLEIDPGRLRLEELNLDDGAISAGGEILLSGGLPSAFDLWLDLDQALVVQRSELDATTTGKLSLTGPIDAPRLEGEVEINPATIRPTVAPGGGAPEADPTVVVVRRYEPTPRWISGVPPALGGETEARPLRPTKADPRAGAGDLDLYDDLAMMITVNLGDSVVVRRYDANLRLAGDVYLTKAPGDELRISGEIGGRRGWYIFQGRRFEIESAYVTFTGETPLDPYLSVNAEYRTGDYLVRIRISGTAAHPNLDLSSDPPLDQSDILAVVLFGKPASQLNDSQGQVLQSQAFALLASYVAPDLQRSVLDTFGLTSLTFSMPTGDTAGTIGVGRYFGDDLFVSVARDFGGPSGGTDRQLQGLVGSSVTIQYYLTPQITVQGASSTEGESSMDVIWHRRY